MTTYGKARKRTPLSGPSKSTGSIPESTGSGVRMTSSSTSPEPQSSTRAGNSKHSKDYYDSIYGDIPDPTAHEGSHSQPLTGSVGTGTLLEGDQRAKKRKITRTYSEKQEKSSRAYSPPESSSSGSGSPVHLVEEIPRSVPKVKAQSRSRGTPEKDAIMNDTEMPFSAKTSRAFNDLNIGPEADKKKQQIPLRLSHKQPQLSRPSVTRKKSSPPPTRPKAQSTSALAPRKKRLIDALAEQADEDSYSEEGEPTLSQESRRQGSPSSPPLRTISPPPAIIPQTRPVVRPVLSSKKSGPKFTYSQQRTMLAEEDDLFSGIGLPGDTGGESKGALFNFGRLTKSSTINKFAFMDEDDETTNAGAVRSIHELRQAGANSRFDDGMDDILDRIGSPSAKPSSMRRGALLELAQNIKEKDFRHQFRNHSGHTNLFNSLRDETDVICGFAITAILSTLLASSVSTHLVRQLRSQGLASLLGRLLKQDTDINTLARERRLNVSKNGQTTLGTIKASIIQLPVWDPTSPELLSPRTLALKCLDLVLRQSDDPSSEADIFSSSVTDLLFSILSDAISSQEAWDFPNHQEAIDFYMALSLVEGYSFSAMQHAELAPKWTTQYVPIVTKVLETALRRPAEKVNELESLALRITLNVTNHNHDASRLFVDRGLLRHLAGSTCGAFDVFLNSMKVDAFLSKVYESLIMMLGAMTNFCMYYPPAAQALEEKEGATGSHLDRLIKVFAEHHSKMAEVR